MFAVSWCTRCGGCLCTPWPLRWAASPSTWCTASPRPITTCCTAPASTSATGPRWRQNSNSNYVGLHSLTRVQIEGRISAAFYSQWSAASLWPSNAIVRHGKDLFRAEGVVNAAEPGNTSHTRSEKIASQMMSRCGSALIVVRSLG